MMSMSAGVDCESTAQTDVFAPGDSRPRCTLRVSCRIAELLSGREKT